jgi:hypothetical protein
MNAYKTQHLRFEKKTQASPHTCTAIGTTTRVGATSSTMASIDQKDFNLLNRDPKGLDLLKRM